MENDNVIITTGDGRAATQEEKNDAASRKLLEAAKLIETALVLLDTSYTNCGHCNSRHWKNMAHANAYQRLTDTPFRLRDCAEQIATSEIKSSTDRRRRRGRGNS